MKPTDYFTAEENRIIDEAIIEAVHMGVPSDGTLGIIPALIMAAVSAAAQIAQNKIRQTKAIRANAEMMRKQAEQMAIAAAQQQKMNEDLASAREKTALMAVATQQMGKPVQTSSGEKVRIKTAVDESGNLVVEEIAPAASPMKSAALPAALAVAAGVGLFLLKR